MSKANEQKLWIVVKEGTIEAFKSLKDAISKFDNLATYVATESQITCLTYNSIGKADPEKGDTPIWSIEQVPLKEIAARILEKMK